MYQEVKGSLIYALALIDQREYEQAKSYIVGALQLFDDQYQKATAEETMVGQSDNSKGQSRSSESKRLKKG